MQYDFETVLDRRGKDAMAVDAVGSKALKGFSPSAPKPGFDVIPMWVADMNFPTARSIQDAIIARAKHPAFGYFAPSDAYYQAIINWHKRKGVDDLTKDVITYENGVLGGIVSTLKVFAAPGDAVLLHSPTYMGFTNCVRSNGFHIVHSPLKRDEAGVWRMDPEDMDKKIKANDIHVAIFCNPFNPCGRVWSREELEAALAVCEANDVFVIADEIWSDLLLNGHRYTPVQSVNAWAKTHTAAFYAPSKTFNLAGLIGSYSVIYNKTVRQRVRAIGQKTIYNAMNVFSEHALIGAYSDEGADWLSQLLPVLSNNVNFACNYVDAHFDGVTAFRSEGTYMLLLDCTDWLENHGITQKALLQKGWDVGVGWQDGHLFEAPTSIRLNLASPTHRIAEAFHRMDRYVFNA